MPAPTLEYTMILHKLCSLLIMVQIYNYDDSDKHIYYYENSHWDKGIECIDSDSVLYMDW